MTADHKPYTIETTLTGKLVIVLNNVPDILDIRHDAENGVLNINARRRPDQGRNAKQAPPGSPYPFGFPLAYNCGGLLLDKEGAEE